MTEDEAKTKWCPFVKCVVVPADGFNSSALIVSSGRTIIAVEDKRVQVEDHCIGSACMAWRWTWVDKKMMDPFDVPRERSKDRLGL